MAEGYVSGRLRSTMTIVYMGRLQTLAEKNEAKGARAETLAHSVSSIHEI